MTTPFSMCGIVLPSGRDCPKRVNLDAPLNLCDPHLEQAHQFYMSMQPERVQATCEICGHDTLHPGVTGTTCGRCGYVSPDFSGRPIALYSEVAEAQKERMPASSDVVYYLRFGDRVKIGTTRDIQKRRMVIPHDALLGTEPGDRHQEAVRHNQFKHLRITGEWFHAAPELLEHAASL